MAKKRKRRKKKVARKTGRAKAQGRAAGPAGLLKQLAAHRQMLEQQQVALQDEMDSIAAAIQALGGADGRRRGARRATRRATPGARRGIRKGSLKSYILRVLKGKGEMAVKDVAVAVRHAGYRTGSSNFPNQVSNALAQMDQVTKTGRGRYRM
ncbi:MAG TPA: hypothetical protein VM243_01915 [Phycisphaerae bacterium]|nr:hypothetical protein [Phycisphaerae bacterium]